MKIRNLRKGYNSWTTKLVVHYSFGNLYHLYAHLPLPYPIASMQDSWDSHLSVTVTVTVTKQQTRYSKATIIIVFSYSNILEYSLCFSVRMEERDKCSFPAHAVLPYCIHHSSFSVYKSSSIGKSACSSIFFIYCRPATPNVSREKIPTSEETKWISHSRGQFKRLRTVNNSRWSRFRSSGTRCGHRSSKIRLERLELGYFVQIGL